MPDLILSPIASKTCTKCGEVKSATSEFFHSLKTSHDSFAWNCKACALIANREKYYKDVQKSRDGAKASRETNTDNVKAARRKHYAENKDRITEQNKKYREKNPEAVKARRAAWYQENKERIAEVRRDNSESLRAKSKAYREQNRDKVLAQKRVHMKLYNANNKEKVRESKRKTLKIRRETDSLYRLKRNTATLIRMKLNSGGYKKQSRTHEILGCDWEFFKSHMERQFLKGMSWENRSDWHIDHILPTSSAKNEEDAIRLNHFTNLRPMWAYENIAKGDKVLTLL